MTDGAEMSPPHGGADRNVDVVGFRGGSAGRPLTGARIETLYLANRVAIGHSRPLTGARIETSLTR